MDYDKLIDDLRWDVIKPNCIGCHYICGGNP